MHKINLKNRPTVLYIAVLPSVKTKIRINIVSKTFDSFAHALIIMQKKDLWGGLNSIVVMATIRKIAAKILQRPATVLVDAGLLCNMKHI